MKSKASTIFLGLLVGLFMSLGLIFATQSFTVSPTSISQSVETGDSGNGVLTLSSTGNESINLTLTKVNFQSGSNSFNLNLNETSISNLENGSSTNVGFSYTAGTTSGTYSGSITVANSQNSSDNTVVPITIEVNPTSTAGPSVKFKDFTTSLTMTLDIDDSSERETFVLVNDGNVTLHDIEFDLDDLTGDEDEIDNDDIELNGEPGDKTLKLDDEEGDSFSLAPGDEYNLKIYIDIPSNLDVDDYRGDLEVSYLPQGATTRITEEFVLKVIAESDDEDVFIDQDSLYVKNGIMEIFIEAGETEDDFEFIVVNDASYDIEDLSFEIDGNFEEEDSSNTMEATVLTFGTTLLDVDERDEETIDFELSIPEDQATGTYLADLNLLSSSGKELDSIQLKIQVVGDIYTKEIKFTEEIKPGDALDVEVTVVNSGSKLYRGIKISASLFDIDSGNSDIHESSSTFLLDSGEETTKTLRFNIPEDATDGGHTLEVRVTYENEEMVDVEQVNVNRDTHKIDIQSFAINPPVAKCDDILYTYMKVKNLGKYDEDVKITSQILNTDVIEESSTFDLEVDDTNQQNLMLDISDLEAGVYKVQQKVTFGSSSIKKESILRIDECSDTVGITIEPINDSEINGNQTSTNETSTNTIELFGTEFEKTTVYLGSGLGFVFVLIVISLFLL